jgi:GTP-binding protein HflX
VIDTNDPDIKEQMEVVENILKQLGCENKPKIHVFNKIDLVPNRKEMAKYCPNKNSVFISAQKKLNLDQLKKKLQTLLKSTH